MSREEHNRHGNVFKNIRELLSQNLPNRSENTSIKYLNMEEQDIQEQYPDETVSEQPGPSPMIEPLPSADQLKIEYSEQYPKRTRPIPRMKPSPESSSQSSEEWIPLRYRRKSDRKQTLSKKEKSKPYEICSLPISPANEFAGNKTSKDQDSKLIYSSYITLPKPCVETQLTVQNEISKKKYQPIAMSEMIPGISQLNPQLKVNLSETQRNKQKTLPGPSFEGRRIQTGHENREPFTNVEVQAYPYSRIVNASAFKVKLNALTKGKEKTKTTYDAEALQRTLEKEIEKLPVKSPYCDGECVIKEVLEEELKKQQNKLKKKKEKVKKAKRKAKKSGKKHKKKPETPRFRVITVAGHITVQGPLTPYPNYGCTIFEYAYFLIAHFLIGACVMPMIMYSFATKHHWALNLHVFLAVIGYQFLIPLAMLVMSRLDFTANYHSRRERYNQTRVFQGVAFVFLIVSFIIILFPYYPNRSFWTIFFNWHVIFGMPALILSFFNIPAIVREQKEETYSAHIYGFINSITFFLTSLCFCTALCRPIVYNWLPYKRMYSWLILLCFLYTFIVILITFMRCRRYMIDSAYKIIYR